MFDTLLLTRRSGSHPFSAALFGLALALHALLAGTAILSSLLRVDPIPPPRREIRFILPEALPRPGAPAPLRGGGGRPDEPKTGIRAPEPEPAEPVRQPPPAPAEIQPIETDPPSPARDPEPGDPEAPAGPGEPGGSPLGVPDGRGNCLFDCDPEGPVTDATWGIRGGAEEKDPLTPGAGGVTEPTIIESTRRLPVYPELARRARVTGQVILQAVIETDGSVSSIRILRETPDRVGFGEAAASAVERWRYRPGMQHGVPVRVVFTVTVDFTLAR
jgi:protein TonB